MRSFLFCIFAAYLFKTTGCGSHEHHAQKHAPAAVGAPVAQTEPTPPPPLPETGPTVQITAPLKNESLTTTDVGVFLAVQGLPASEGAHLHVMLDNQPPGELSDAALPIIFRNLAPGQHVVRAFTCDGRHVSFKNRAAFSMVWFSVAGQAAPSTVVSDPLPTLTLNLPLPTIQKTETKKMRLDFLVTGLEPGSWRVRLSVDGASQQVLDRYGQTILQDLTVGEHTVRLELLDAKEQPLPANFATSERTVRVR